MNGSTDTTFYVLAVYWSVGVSKIRHAVAGLAADLTGAQGRSRRSACCFQATGDRRSNELAVATRPSSSRRRRPSCSAGPDGDDDSADSRMAERRGSGFAGGGTGGPEPLTRPRPCAPRSASARVHPARGGLASSSGLRSRAAVPVGVTVALAANSAWTTGSSDLPEGLAPLATAEAMRRRARRAAVPLAAAVGYRSDGSRAHARLAIRPRAWGTCGGTSRGGRSSARELLDGAPAVTGPAGEQGVQATSNR